MKIYVVITEENFGGLDKIKIFYNPDCAIHYAETIEGVDSVVLECSVVYPRDKLLFGLVVDEPMSVPTFFNTFADAMARKEFILSSESKQSIILEFEELDTEVDEVFYDLPMEMNPLQYEINENHEIRENREYEGLSIL